MEMVLPLPARYRELGRLGGKMKGPLTRTVEDNASLPGNTKVFVNIFAVKKLLHQLGQGLLHVLIQDHVVPICLLYLIV